MAKRTHMYRARVAWTGRGQSPSFRNHVRSYEMTADGKPAIAGSSEPVFRGDSARWNPEDLFVASLSSCHHLWYMGLCAAAGIEVLSYEDSAEGVMEEEAKNGAGQFVEVVLRPRVVLAPGSDVQKAEQLHHRAHENCFIARSVNFSVVHRPSTEIAPVSEQPAAHES
jgi:organic hydroperoxide reductase OsmC/OhrA